MQPRRVSTRQMDKLVKTMGINALSKFPGVPNGGGPGRGRPVHVRGRPRADRGDPRGRPGDQRLVLLATGVNGDGHREVLGMPLAQTGAAWNEFPADLVTRGLVGVRLVTSDSYAGLREAIAANLPGAFWQRCRTTTPRT